MTRIYAVVCEWDIGLDNLVFETEATAIAAAENALKVTFSENTYDELEDEGLIFIDELILVREEPNG